MWSPPMKCQLYPSRYSDQKGCGQWLVCPGRQSHPNLGPLGNFTALIHSELYWTLHLLFYLGGKKKAKALGFIPVLICLVLTAFIQSQLFRVHIQYGLGEPASHPCQTDSFILCWVFCVHNGSQSCLRDVVSGLISVLEDYIMGRVCVPFPVLMVWLWVEQYLLARWILCRSTQ